MSTTFKKLSRDALAALSPERQTEYRKNYAKYLRAEQARQAAERAAVDEAVEAVNAARREELKKLFNRPLSEIDLEEFTALCTEVKKKPGLGLLNDYLKICMRETLLKHQCVLWTDSPRGSITGHIRKRLNCGKLEHVPNEDTGKLETFVTEIFTQMQPDTKDIAAWWEKLFDMSKLPDELPPTMQYAEFGLLPTQVTTDVLHPALLASELVKMVGQAGMEKMIGALDLSTTTPRSVEVVKFELYFTTAKKLCEQGGYAEGSVDPATISPATIVLPDDMVTITIDGSNTSVKTTGVPGMFTGKTIRRYRQTDGAAVVTSIETTLNQTTGGTLYGFDPRQFAAIAEELMKHSPEPLYLAGISGWVKSTNGTASNRKPVAPEKFVRWDMMSFYTESLSTAAQLPTSIFKVVEDVAVQSLSSERDPNYRLVRRADAVKDDGPQVGEEIEDPTSAISLGRGIDVSSPVKYPEVHAAKPRPAKFVPDTSQDYEWVPELGELANLRRKRQWFNARLKETDDKEEREQIEAEIETLRLKIAELREKEAAVAKVGRRDRAPRSAANGSPVTKVLARAKDMLKSADRKRKIADRAEETGEIHTADHMPARSPPAAAGAAVGGLKESPSKRAKTLAKIGAPKSTHFQISVMVQGEDDLDLSTFLDAEPEVGQIVTIKGEQFELTECYEDNAEEECAQNWFGKRVEADPKFMDDDHGLDLTDEQLADFDDDEE